MKYSKTIVCFANSRKTSGCCIAGKEWRDGNPGEWVRPVSTRPTHEISEEERRYEDGRDPQLLDIVLVPCESHQPSPYQRENHVIDPTDYWARREHWHGKILPVGLTNRTRSGAQAKAAMPASTTAWPSGRKTVHRFISSQYSVFGSWSGAKLRSIMIPSVPLEVSSATGAPHIEWT